MKQKGLFLVLTVLLAFTSCTEQPAVSLELYYYKQEIADEMPGFVELFEAANPGITVELLIVPNDENKTLNTRAAAGDLPDIVQLQSYAAVQEFASKGYLLDLSDEPIMDSVIESAMPAVSLEGKQYALPMDFAGIGIIYNKAIFDQYGLNAPTTYSELEEVALTLQENGVTPFAGLLKENWSIGHFITLVHTSLIGAQGGNEAILSFIDQMNAGETSYGDVVDFDRVVSIIDFYQDNMDAEALEMNWDEQQAAFANETAAMMVQGLWSYGAAIGTNPDLDVGFVPFPVTDNAADTKFYADVDSTFAISAQSTPEEQAAAKTFLSWLKTDEAVDYWTGTIKLTSSFKGASTESMDGVFQDLMNSVNAKGSYPWAFSMYPNPTWESATKGASHAYVQGSKTADEIISDIDSSWAAEIASR
jgi:raffinose/stachyose/melibiose transport system substrate-binding protein